MPGSSWDLSWMKQAPVRSIEEAAQLFVNHNPGLALADFETELGRQTPIAEHYLTEPLSGGVLPHAAGVEGAQATGSVSLADAPGTEEEVIPRDPDPGA